MEDLFKALAPQAPSLVVLVILVWIFIKEIRAGREQSDTQQKACHEAHAKVFTSVEKITSDTNEVIRRNSEVIGTICTNLDDQRQHIADAVRDGIDKSACAKRMLGQG